ncbi:MAG: hypothetical protein ABIV47_24300 [Roseiflexaceae bacterium]
MAISPDQTSYMKPAGRDATSDANYTAVVYFHGMGTQRHYEEVSSLLQQFDQLIYRNHFPGNPRSLQKCIVEVEQGRAGSGLENTPVTYHKVTHPVMPGSNDPVTVRFYETYWAAETVSGTNTLSVIAWVLKQVAKPIMVLKAQWGEIGSLRIGTLYSQYEQVLAQARKQNPEQPYVPPDDPQVQQIKFLISSYREFIKPETRYGRKDQSPKRGERFRDYVKYLQEYSYDAEYKVQLPALLQAANTWWWQDIFAQISYFLMIMLLLLLLLGAMFSSLWVIYAVVVGLVHTLWIELQRALPTFGLPNLSQHAGQDSPTNALLILILLPLTVMIGARVNQFFSDYLGDVQQYVTYQETDQKYQRRARILARTISLLRHVLQDEHCTRVIVISHSLGSVIAYDSLLELQRINLALKSNTNQPNVDSNDLDVAPTPKLKQLGLDKIQHFVTMGSPIDKTLYFFATLRSRVSRYVETVEAIRGNITTPPFTIPKQGQEEQGWLPQIHWVNYWDQADAISGPIWNVVGAEIDIQHVDNVRVATYRLPEPAHSHGGYFYHKQVLSDLYEMIFENRFSFVQARAQGRKPEWVADTVRYTKDAEANQLFPKQRAIQLLVLIVATLGLDYAVLQLYARQLGLFFALLADLLSANPLGSASPAWVLVPALVVVIALVLLILVLRQSLKPRAAISVSVPPTQAAPEQAHG